MKRDVLPSLDKKVFFWKNYSNLPLEVCNRFQSVEIVESSFGKLNGVWGSVTGKSQGFSALPSPFKNVRGNTSKANAGMMDKVKNSNRPGIFGE